MKKEVVFAITIGFTLGLLLTFFLYKSQFNSGSANSIVSPLGDKIKTEALTPFPSQSLSIISPIDQSIAKEGKTVVSGISAPLSWLIIMGEKGEKVVQADEKGNFETDLLLVSGENEITISSINAKGEKVEKQITIVYSTVEI